MKFKGKVTDISLNLDGTPKITLTANDKKAFLEQVDDVKDLEIIDVEIKKHRQKRSKNANDYLWVLITEISEHQGCDPLDVYKKEIREAGVHAAMCCKTEFYDRTAHEWGKRGLGWFCDVTDEGNGYTWFLMHYGSSSYDTAEMSRLINATVEDARALGIEVLSERELSLLKGL